MGTDVSADSYRCLLVPDERVKNANITTASDGTAPSTITQATPLPGIAEDQNTPTSGMVFETSGTQSGGKQLRLRTGRGGFPGVDTRGGGLLWKEEADASTAWRGWDPPSTITSWEPVQFIANAVTTEASKPHIIRLQSGKLLAAYHYAATGAGDDTVRTRTLTLGSAWSSSVSTQPSSQHADLNPCLIELPDASVLMLMWSVDTTANTANIVVYRTTDEGSTWTLASSAGLVTDVNTSTYSIATSAGNDYGKLRGVYSNGQILLFASVLETATPRLIQYASDDLGASFSTVSTWSGGDDGQGAEPLAKADGGFLVLWFDVTSGVSFASLSSAYQALSSSDATTITAAGASANPVAAWTDEDRVHYVIYRRSTGDATIARSTDDGASFTGFGGYTRGLFGATEYHHQTSGAATQGRAVILFKAVSAGGSTHDDETINALYLGGSTDLTLPSASGGTRQDTSLLSFQHVMVGIATGTDTAIGVQQAGAPTETFTSTGYNIATGGSDSNFWREVAINDTDGLAVADDTREWIVFYDIVVASGGADNSDVISVEVLAGDATHDYRVSIRMTTTGYAAYDVHAGANIGTATVDFTAGVQILAALRGGNGGNDGVLAVYHRLAGTASTNDRSGWTAGPSSTTVNEKGGSPLGTERVEWGHRATGSGDSTWRFVQYVALASGITRLTAAAFTNPDDLFPRPISRFPIGIDDGVRVAAVDGPTYEGELWNIDTRYGYGVENIDPRISPSPRRTWRTTAETKEDVVWDLVSFADTTRRMTTTLGLYLGAINWRTGSLWGGTAAGAYTKIADLDAAEGQATLAYVRDGDVVRVNTGSTTNADEWLTFNDYAGGTAELDVSGTPVYRKILHHTEGRWTDSTTKRPEFFLSGCVVGDAASGNLHLWSPRMLVVIHNITEYRYLKLQIDAQTTRDGYLETGIVMLGPVLFFARQYSQGRVVARRTNTAVTTTGGGSRISRNLGPSRGRVNFSWREGVDALQLNNSATVTPDYILGTSGADPVAADADTPYKVRGMLDHLDGPNTPVVYLPRVDKTDEVRTYTRWDESMYARVMSSESRLESILGDEMLSEVFRIGAVELEEEV